MHGRDDGKLAKVARFLESKLKVNVTILNEKTNKGQTVIEKFEVEASATSFAVVLMTADDEGRLIKELNSQKELGLNKRARQNVIFELGYFLAKFGRQRVCVLLDDGVEKHSDYAGVVYISLDEHEGWHKNLAKELQVSGIAINPSWWE